MFNSLSRRLAAGHARRWPSVALLAGALLALPAAPPATAASVAVACGDVAGLVAAIAAANATAEADTIELAAGCTYTLTSVDNVGAPSPGGPPSGPNGLPLVTGPLTVAGRGATIARSVAAATPDFRIFAVSAAAALTLTDLTLRGGRAGAGGLLANHGGASLVGVTIADGSASIGGGLDNRVGAMTLTRSTIIGNRAQDGGGISNDGTLRLVDTAVRDNVAEGRPGSSSGGGILNDGLLTVERGDLTGNESSSVGGGLWNSREGEATVTGATIAANKSSQGGGAFNDGVLTLTGATVSGNRAGGGGGLALAAGSLALANATVSGNTALQQGGGLWVYPALPGGSATSVAIFNSTVVANAATDQYSYGGGVAGPARLRNSVVAGNAARTSGADDCGSGAVSAGHNLVGRGAGCPSGQAGDRAVAPAEVFTRALGPLADNGGPTRTHLPLVGSPAIDGAEAAVCAAPPVGGVDQRGVTRPQGPACDIGAVEGEGGTPQIGATTWYFAEGYTGPGFDEYLTLQNPNADDAQVTITYYLGGGAPVTKSLTVPANSRYTVTVHDAAQGVGRGKEVSAKVVSTNGVGIVAERPMYFNYLGATTGGHNVMGVNAPRTSWLFAEGYTGPGFDEYLTLMNPNADPAPVTITYYLGGGQPPVVKSLTLQPNSRYTVTVHDGREGVGRNQEVSAKVETGHPDGIVAERPMYFTYTGGMGAVTGGHNVMGAAGPLTAWYFPEGNTTLNASAGWDEYLTIMNPAAEAAEVRLTYYPVGAQPFTKDIIVAANSRFTVVVHEAAHVGRNKTHGTKVETTNGVGIVVERPLYFKYSATVNGGHDVMGASAPRQTWLFAEGYTGPGFDEYLIVLNPNPAPAPVTITYYLNGGSPVVRTLTVNGNSRATVSVHDVGQVGQGKEVSAKVETTNAGGIVVERPMYFVYTGGIDGGHTAMGYAP